MRRTAIATVASMLMVLAGCAAAQGDALDSGPDPSGVQAGARALRLPAGVQRLTDIAYGPADRQRFDVYLPRQTQPEPRGAAIIVMVHGGAWMIGNKGLPQVVENKVAHWTTPRAGQGAIFVSIDYRLVPQVTPLAQADDVAKALAKVQSLAASWGGDPDRIVLMGHSAGAHLVSLVSASPAFAQRAGARRWLGTVVLDSAALDLTHLMGARHARFYDRVFGDDPSVWRAASPADSLAEGGVSMLLVCSKQRTDGSCDASAAFAERANRVGVRTTVSQQDLSHGEINATLGLPGSETDAVDAFLLGVGAGLRSKGPSNAFSTRP